MLITVVESPLYLQNTGEFTKMKKQINKIARLNSVSEFIEEELNDYGFTRENIERYQVENRKNAFLIQIG